MLQNCHVCQFSYKQAQQTLLRPMDCMNLTLSTPIVVLLAGQQVPFGASLAPETGTPFRLWLLAPGLRFHLIVFCDGIEGDCVGSTETYRDSQIVICMSTIIIMSICGLMNSLQHRPVSDCFSFSRSKGYSTT